MPLNPQVWGLLFCFSPKVEGKGANKVRGKGARGLLMH